MRVLFLTEAGSAFGYGHLARCMAIKDAFDIKKVFSQIIAHSAGQPLPEGILRMGILIRNWYENTAVLEEAIHGYDIVFVDSYHCTEKIYKVIANKIPHPVYLDDFNRIKYPPGSIVNGNIYGEDFNYSTSPSHINLLGPRYLALRKAFWNPNHKKINQDIKQVLVVMGTGDVGSITRYVLKAIERYYPQCSIDIIGQDEGLPGNGHANVRQYRDLSAVEMKNIILDADIAVSSGGQIAYELCRIGTPFIAIKTAQNQEQNINKLYELSLLPELLKIESDELFPKLERSLASMTNINSRISQSELAKEIFSENGAQNIVNRILLSSAKSII